MRELYDIPREVTYLNCAYVSPLLNSVARAVEQGLEMERHPWTLTPDDFFDPPQRLRALFAEMIGAQAGDIAIVPSASYGLATAAANLPIAQGQSILMLQEEYPSNVYSWQRLAAASGAGIKTVARPADGDWTAAILEALDERVAIAALAHNHWMDGALIDLERVGEALRAQGAALVVDTSQSCGALPFDVARIQPDFMVTCGYKWMHCPYSISFLYAAPHRQAGQPIEENPLNREGARAFARLADYTDRYAPGAIAALEQLNEWGVANIQAALREKTAQVAEAGKALGLSVLPEERRAGHFLGLVFEDGVPEGTAQRFAEQKIFVSVRGSSVRVTPHLYNDDEDIERFLAALRSL